ncbi:hypothetical protein FHS23_002123 [Prauserella isguenensis]|uniref:MmpS family membrane protein n=1 Tax=Prauserella isguenensis TaxID=1470180 RepID=A0A839S222_9PSEU|nr:hypothetical protein [Prauserella isguenensis]MBB3051100.1 hypothetical protein [Prauserella isguenensis]
MHLGRAAAGVVLGIAILFTGAASAALEPTALEPTAPDATRAAPHTPSSRTPSPSDPHHSPDPAPDTAGPHTVRIHVSGPDDTLMRVLRGDQGTQVALGGEPFDHSFTEPAGSDGHLGIRVAAASKQAGHPAVRCRITVDGDVVAQERATERDETGLAQVQCAVPRGV